MIKDNPFYILNLPMSARKMDIVAKAETMSLRGNPGTANEAMTVLLNPLKRISAEISWFPEDGEESVEEVLRAVNAGERIDSSALSVSGKLTAELYNLEQEKPGGMMDEVAERIAASVWAIDRLYTEVTADRLYDAINLRRMDAGIPLTEQELIKAEREQYRTKIRALITDCLDGFDMETHAMIAARLMRQQAADLQVRKNRELLQKMGVSGQDPVDTGAQSGIVVSDVMAQYELRMQPVFEETKTELKGLFESSDGISKYDFVVRRHVDKILRAIERWKKYAGPLMIYRSGQGMTWSGAEKMADLVWNNRHRVWNKDQKQRMLLAMRDALEPVPELAKRFDTLPVSTGRKVPGKSGRTGFKIVFYCLMALMVLGIFITVLEPDPTPLPSGSGTQGTPSAYTVEPPKIPDSLKMEEYEMPQSGTIMKDHRELAGQNTSEFTVINVSEGPYTAALYAEKEKLTDPDPEDDTLGDKACIVDIFVGAGQQVTVPLPPGEYYVYLNWGEKWYGPIWQFKSFENLKSTPKPLVIPDGVNKYIKVDSEKDSMETGSLTNDAEAE
ncbi:MAG: hypothetical protein IJH77_01850 [Mogibacterium sp.]|nr:hypothetical protein [Mogibacterium sp.]